MSFITELRLKGLNISEKEAEKLKRMAVEETRAESAVLLYQKDEKGFFAMLFIVVALVRVLNELMGVAKGEEQSRFKMKRDLKLLRTLTKSIYIEFEKNISSDQELLNAYKDYSDDFSELIYEHMDAMVKNMKD